MLTEIGHFLSSELRTLSRLFAFVLLSCLALVSSHAQPDPIARSDALFNDLFNDGISTDEALFGEARALWEQLAEEGNARASYYLSFLYWMGLGGVPIDEAESLRLAHASANAGYAPAQGALANAYERGIIVDKNEALAVEWWVRAAENGSWIAQSRLERAYTLGELGLPIDREEAERWRRSETSSTGDL